jgi:hypothetical protein
MRLLAPEHFAGYLPRQAQITGKLGLAGDLLQRIDATSFLRSHPITLLSMSETILCIPPYRLDQLLNGQGLVP